MADGATGFPKIFISYRWTSPDHEEWVLQFATSLRSDGVDVILDKWHLQEGQDTLVFMEQMVSDPSVIKVLLICDEAYVDRANSRTGGVGTEAQIVSASVYNKTDQNKFAAVVRELNSEGQPFLPHYMATRLYFNMSSIEAEAVNYDKLLRWIHGKPFHALPPIGEPPKFLETTYAAGSSIVRATRRPSQTNLPSDQLTAKASDLLTFIADDAPSFIRNLVEEEQPENAAYEGIKATFPVLENLNLALSDLVRAGDQRSIDTVHSFFEKIFSLWDYHPVNSKFTRLDNDAYQFFGHNAFVSFVAIAMRERSFAMAADVLSTPFFKPRDNQNTGEAVSYSKFKAYLQSLETRNSNMKLNRLSLHADLLAEHHEHSSVAFNYFMEADLTLFVRGILSPKDSWYPDSSIYLSDSYGALPTFARATSTRVYEKLKVILFNKSPNELRQQITNVSVPRSAFREIPIRELLNLEKLATAA